MSTDQQLNGYQPSNKIIALGGVRFWLEADNPPDREGLSDLVARAEPLSKGH